MLHKRCTREGPDPGKLFGFTRAALPGIAFENPDDCLDVCDGMIFDDLFQLQEDSLAHHAEAASGNPTNRLGETAQTD